MKPLTDQDARDRAINFPDQSMLLEAGAGTGKTNTMVNRLVEAVRQKSPIERQVAITFTVKAAYELLDRLRKELETSEDLICRESVQHLTAMRAGTIDSVVQRLLEENPLAAGVGAGFRILSTGEFLDRFTVWFKGKFEEWSGDPALSGAWQTLDDLELKLKQKEKVLTDVARCVATKGEAIQIVGADLDADREIDRWRDTDFATAISLVPGTGNLESIANDNIQILAGNAAELTTDPFAELAPLKKMATTGGNLAKPCRDGIKAAKENLETLAAALRFALVAPLLQKVADDAFEFARDLTANGLLSFDRALGLAVRMLDSDPEALRQACESISSVMVDEFQDTSLAQIQLVRLLCAGGRLPLFVVGDPKQSIYRFRGADLTGYLSFRREALEMGLECRSLISNFRSHGAILSLVNQVFEPKFSAGDGPGYESLNPHAAGLESVEAHAWVVGGSEDSAAMVRTREAETVVRAVTKAQAEAWFVRVGEQVRPLRLSDVAVLYRSRSALPTLTRKLSAASIPYRIESESNVFDTDEARAVLNVLRATTRTVEDDHASVAIARLAALRSLSLNIGLGELTDGIEPAKGDALLAELTVAIEGLGPFQAVAYILDRFRLEMLAGGSRRPRSVINRHRAVLDRAMEAEGIMGVRAFVDLVDAEGDSRLMESPAPESDEDAVRLMTVHAAKGLEFPMVVVVGFGGQPHSAHTMLSTREGGLLVKLGNKELAAQPLKFEAAAEREKAQEEAEADRLLYVAMTRARDHLVVSAYHHGRSSELGKSLADWSEAGDPLSGDEGAIYNPPEVFKARDTGALLGAWAKVLQEDRRTTPTRAAASPAADDRNEYDPDASPELDEDYPFRSPAAKQGTSLGLAVHKVLQLVDLANPDLEANAASTAALFGVDPQEVMRFAKRALATDTLLDARAAPKCWREVYVATVRGVEEELLEGIIDLVYERPDGSLGVVDYKTDRVRNMDDATERMRQGYTRQGLAYRELLEGATGLQVSSVKFIFLNLDPAVVCEI